VGTTLLKCTQLTPDHRAGFRSSEAAQTVSRTRSRVEIGSSSPKAGRCGPVLGSFNRHTQTATKGPAT